MQKNNAKRKRNVRNLAAVTTLTAIILIVSTYAWFIGLEDVSVNAFNVTINPTRGLELSIDGATWYGGPEAVGDALKTNLAINEDNYNTGAYAGNTNSWTGVLNADEIALDDTIDPIFNGLSPLSSSGQVLNGVMTLYEKRSLTSTDLDDATSETTGIDWGYRLMADPLVNYDTTNSVITEQNGYIAFDLFIKNNNSIEDNEAHYYSTVDMGNEEAIYLTMDSEVTVGAAGVAGYGIENSVRVGFAQIGRVQADAATSTATAITGITCTTADVVTGICRPASIWEPNDTDHVAAAIDHYNTNCSGIVTTDNTGRDCSLIENGTAYPTYAVSGQVTVDHELDIYDGFYNGSALSTEQQAIVKDLNAEDVDGNEITNAYDLVTGGVGSLFTDTDKEVEGPDREAFMYLAPNSITKVRVYVWIEGQDIDNYDWAGLGKQITVNFGFTKQQLSDEYISSTL